MKKRFFFNIDSTENLLVFTGANFLIKPHILIFGTVFSNRKIVPNRVEFLNMLQKVLYLHQARIEISLKFIAENAADHSATPLAPYLYCPPAPLPSLSRC